MSNIVSELDVEKHHMLKLMMWSALDGTFAFVSNGYVHYCTRPLSFLSFGSFKLSLSYCKIVPTLDNFRNGFSSKFDVFNIENLAS